MRKALWIVLLVVFSRALCYSQAIDSLMIEGSKLQNIEKYSAAIEVYNSILNLDGNHCNAIYQKALCLMRTQKASEALELYLKLIDIRPDFIGGVYGAATAYVSLKNWNKGMDYINIVITAEPENAEYYIIRGQIYLEMAEKKKACNDFKKAKKLGSLDAKIIMKIHC
ncbi:MAG: CDC27 family protein [Salinivirgaceae bacterium]|nr:CDC27 family protein [Salinivirgaceae bacterium]MDY0282005.1 CDC27 family protein [Salinivirgaceae bacterium]